jgi:hypothetical protein
MTGRLFQRKLKSGASWGYAFFAGRDRNGKRIQIFKSGFETKAAASTASRAARGRFRTPRTRRSEHRAFHP